jgi:serine acetyltransferase
VSVGDSGTVGGAAAASKGVAAGTTVVGVPAFSLRAKPAFIPAERQAEAERRRAP